MGTTVIGLRYEPGMNFHELVCHGIRLSEYEKKQLQVELRRRYSDFILSEDELAVVKLTTQIKDLSNDWFETLIVPSGNDRFKNIYLLQSSKISTIRGGRKRGKEGCCQTSQAIRKIVAGVFNNDPLQKQFAKESLVDVINDTPSNVSQLLLIGAAVASVISDKSNQKMRFVLSDASEEGSDKKLTTQKKLRRTWLSSFRFNRSQ